MKWDDLYVAAVGTWLPGALPVERAVEEGRYDAERARARDYVSVCVDEDTAPPDMAVRAGRSALERSGTAERDFSLLLHSSLWYQGLDIWPTASYVAADTVGRFVPAFDVQQRCNGALGAIELAGAHLRAGIGKGHAALVTTADRFAPPAVDRWNMHDYNVYGDGGTAMVLSTRGGFARVLSTATVVDNSLEAAARGDQPLRRAPDPGTPVDLVARAARHAAAGDAKQTELRTGRLINQARNQALADSRTQLKDLARVVIGATGRFEHGYHFHHLLQVPESLTTWEYGRTTGHIGAGDWNAGLDWLVRTRAVAPGDRVLLFGGGAGYSCTAAVLEITELPDWGDGRVPTSVTDERSGGA
ncbi:ketoacyl-ACP synthase III family protein [Streptomyces sp. TG1A-8]|uniref:ketoacyl-ACP synthase III family protein n=1 Tax=Streptomyces sp. TG1A-8 TaxID=3051385 RepID=UPI00265C6FFE|nr:ketoacyl-ACP synthase III family protein [Streptomyces sp. TG1A-8]MDO0926702.1 ketoacyl-ACP synthase III family protein [Streptomyces sp. TG1A-8]